MKKFLSLLMAFILAVGVFSIGAYADSYQLPDFSTISAEVYLTNSDGVTNHLYLKNGKAFIEGAEIPLFGGIKIKLNLLLVGEYGYVYPTFFPFIHIQLPAVEIEYTDPDDLEFTHIKSYNEKVGNTTYYVDEYMTESGITKYFFSDNELKFCETTDEYGYTTKLSLESTDVDDRIFEIPFYSINITFIFDWLFPKHIM